MTDDTPDRLRREASNSSDAASTLATSGSNYKVLGDLDDPGGIGVLGRASSGSGNGEGVRGEVPSADDGAAGVRGVASDDSVGSAADGVRGTTNATGERSGGLSDPAEIASGVAGEATNTSGVETYGVYGSNQATGDGTAGIGGFSFADEGKTYGVRGLTSSKSDGAAGVWGDASDTTGSIHGVKGTTGSPGGYGLTTPDDARIEGNVATTSGFTVTVGGDSVLRLDPSDAGDSVTVVAGWKGNSAGDAAGATIAGGGASGVSNEVTDDYGTVGGGYDNRAGDAQSGTDNATHATVGGGFRNDATGERATVGGGASNDAGGTEATVGGGHDNAANGTESTVGGGGANVAAGNQSTVAGGQLNCAFGNADAIGGGSTNQTGVSGTTQNFFATVPGGEDNVADGKYSFAAGREAKVGGNDGAFVWGDSSDTTVTASAPDEVRFQASGGFVLDGGLPSGTGTNVEIDSNGALVADTSSARYKTDVRPLDPDPKAALDLEARRFEYEDSGEEDVGYLAEEVEEVLPELVVRDAEGRPDSVRYDRLGVFLLPAVREHRRRLEDVEDRLAEGSEDDFEDHLAGRSDDDVEDRLAAGSENRADLIEAQRERIERLQSDVAALRDRLSELEERGGGT